MKALLRRFSTAFGSSEYTHVQPTFDYLAAELGGWMIAEDLHGRLLYASGTANPDLWRTDYTPFSLPSHSDHARYLDDWSQHLSLYGARRVELGLREDRIIIPLTYQGALFAYVHIVSSAGPNCLDFLLDRPFVKIIGDKLYIVIIGTMNAIRRQFLSGDTVAEQVREWSPELTPSATRYQVFCVRLGEMTSVGAQHSVIDYASIAVRHTLLLSQAIVRTGLSAEGVELRVLHRREDDLQAMIVAEYRDGFPEEPELVERGLRSVLQAAAWTATVGISPIFAHRGELLDRIAQACQILTLGIRQGTERRVFSQQDIGLDAFLLPLTQSFELRQYANTILSVLLDRDPALLETLRVYLAFDANATRTAEHFRVDRRTVTYRLSRIEETLDLDLSVMKDRVLVFLALTTVDAD